MMDLRIIKWCILAFLGLTSCYYDVAENLFPPTECVTTGLSYANQIVPILEFNCYSCHSAAANTGNVTLEGYDKLMKHVNSGRLAGAINHASGFSPMPQGAPKLSDCDIAKIEQWIEDGSPRN